MKNNTGSNPRHLQTMLTSPEGDDISVDSNLAELISLLWASGIPTNFSCEGEPTEFSWGEEDHLRHNPSYNEALERRAYISMPNTFQSRALIIDLVGSQTMGVGQQTNSMWDFEFSHYHKQGARVCIRFPHNDIPKFASWLILAS